MQSTNFWDPIKSNNFRIFKEKPPARISKAAQKQKLLKNDCQLFSRLFIGCTNRSADLDEFFEHENQPFPISISDNGHLRIGSKSDILECLQDLYREIEVGEPKGVTCFLIEGAIIPHFLTPRELTTFAEYSAKVKAYIKSFTDKYKRVDIVYDIYKSDSLKNSTRKKRGKGRAQEVKANLCIPKNWTNFLSVGQNKEELFKLLSIGLLEQTYDQCLGVSTFGDQALCSENHDKSKISPCDHEESDTRIFVHALDAVSSGHRRIIIRTVDSDVVVLAVSFVAQVKEVEELWVAFGTKNKFRYIPIHIIVEKLGKKMSLALPFFHALTGCDTVSAFYGVGKVQAFKEWMAIGDSLTSTFLHIASESPDNLSECEYYRTCEKFIAMCYDFKYARESHCSLDMTRKYLFVKKNRKLESIPPTSAAFQEHLKRAILQGVFCWGSTTSRKIDLPDPTFCHPKKQSVNINRFGPQNPKLLQLVVRS